MPGVDSHIREERLWTPRLRGSNSGEAMSGRPGPLLATKLKLESPDLESPELEATTRGNGYWAVHPSSVVSLFAPFVSRGARGGLRSMSATAGANKAKKSGVGAAVFFGPPAAGGRGKQEI